VSSCCFARGPRITYPGVIVEKTDLENALDKLIEWRRENIGQLRENRRTTCFGCQWLRYGRYRKNIEITECSINGAFAGCRCNLNCVFCAEMDGVKNKQSGRQVLSTFDVFRIAAQKFEHMNFAAPCAGEFSVLPDRDLILNFFRERNWTAQWLTNAVVYNDLMAEILKRPGSSMVVSLDCGTRETCRRVKNADVYEKIVLNTKKYSRSGGCMELKYVVLPGMNDSLEDINGFVNVVQEVNPRSVTLSFDLFEFRNKPLIGKIKERDVAYNEHMPEPVFATFAYFVARIRESGVPLKIAPDRFSNPDYERLGKL
jgi:pyruvate-formate lyase-activating enzyme